MTTQKENPTKEFVTVRIGSQLFGLPISRAHDVFIPEAITEVPMAPEAVAGILNLRGRIVTVIDMRQMLHLPPRSADAPRGMAVGIEYNGEIFGLMIDAVGEVLRLDDGSVDQNPINLDAGWAGVSKGVYRLEGELMVILDVDRVLASQMPGAKAA